jgi:hypothetical protein
MKECSNSCLFRRSTGVYYVLYTRDGRRRWKSTGCKTKTDALKAVAEFEELSEPKPARTLLSDFIHEFLPYATVMSQVLRSLWTQQTTSI